MIANRVLCIEARDWQSFKLAAEFLDSLHFLPLDSENARRAEYTLRLGRGGSEATTCPPNQQSFAITRGRCWMDAADRCFFDVDDSSIVINEKERGIVEVRFGETPHAQHPTAIINVLTYAVFVLLRRMGLFDLHAAAVVSPEGERGALIVGDSGSGKSSLTVRLAASGWGYVSDDMVALCKDASGVQAHGLRRIFTLTQATLDACKLSEADESHEGFWLTDPDKRRLAPETLFPRRFVGSCVPRTMFFPTITGEATSSTKRITQGEAMTLLVRRCPWAGYDRAVAPEYLQTLARLARQTAAYELRAGRDLLDTADCAATLFAAHL